MLISRVLVAGALLAFDAAMAAYAESLQAQFERFLSWWPGVYDNAAQAQARPEAFSPIRLYLAAVEQPAFGSEVVYGEWQAMDSPHKVLRQRFYAFEIDEGRQALRLNLHIFPPDPVFQARTAGAYEDPSRVSELTPQDMVPLPGCDVYFTWQDDHFAGAMDRGACAFKAPGTDDDIYSWSQMRLTAGTFEYLDGWFNPDGTVYRQLGEGWTVLERR